MYTVSQYEDRHFMACSVPPDANNNLDKDFQELSRIHFYLGHSSVKHMFDAVEKASLEDIERGKVQLIFAAKEVQEFFSSSYGTIDTSSSNKLDPNLYFNKAFKNILEKANECLEEVYKYPTDETNFIKASTMAGLAQEVMVLQTYLNNACVNTDSHKELMLDVKNNYEKIYKLKDSYDALKELKAFDSYKANADKSVLEQLQQPYQFNYSRLSDMYYDDGHWVRTLQAIREQQKDIDTPEYKFNHHESQRLKDNFVTQMKSFNRLLENGVVNYVFSYAAAISKEIFYTAEKSKVPAQSYFDRDLNYHQEEVKKEYGRSKGYHQQKIDQLLEAKDEIIKNKTDDKTFYENYLTLLNRQEQNIIHTIDKIQQQVLNVKENNTLTFTGDIKSGFVVGQFSSNDKVMLIHKDDAVDVVEAVYAGIMSKQTYESLVNSNELKFEQDWKQDKFENGSNFWSYGQFLQELNNKEIQQSFLGETVDLVDQTMIHDTKQSKRLK
jgi:hypothetical protein